MDLPADSATVQQFGEAYLKAGWNIIPIRPHDKRPLVPWERFERQRATGQELRQWLRQWPQMNLAIVTGSISQLAVVDVDGTTGRESLSSRGLHLPPTLTQKTPHGWHSVYQLNGQHITNRAGIAPGVDIRGDGGYIVVAPSTLVDGRYIWELRTDPAPVPDWLQAIGAEPRSDQVSVTDAPTWVRETLATGMAKGSRNAMATRLAGYFRSRGLPEDVINAVLQPYAALCRPPLPTGELQQIVRSIMRYRVTAEQLGITSPPTMLHIGGGFRFEYETVGIQLELRDFDSKHHELNAELVVESSFPGLPPRIHGPVRFNLLSTSTRTALCNYLDKRLAEIPWSTIVEDTARLAVETFRTGDPLIPLEQAIVIDSDGWLIRPLLVSDGPSLWFADGASGKSLLALAAAAAITTGQPFLGRKPTARLRVALLDWEWDGWRHKDRLTRMLGPNTDAHRDILHRRCHAPLADQVESLARLFDQEEIGYYIVDSVGPACGGEPETSKSAIAYFEALARLRRPSLNIAHNTKAGDEHKPFGSTYFYDLPRCVWYIAKAQEFGEDTLSIGFLNRKSNAGRLERPIGCTVIFDQNTIQLQHTESRYSASIAEKVPLRERILLLLERLNRATSVLDIAEQLGVSNVQQVRSRLNDLLASHRVIKLPSGTDETSILWGLPAPPGTAPDEHLTPSTPPPLAVPAAATSDNEPF